MNKKDIWIISIIILILLVIVEYSAIAQETTFGDSDEGMTLIVLDLTTPPHSITKDENKFDVVQIEGFELSGGIGDPQLPYRVYNLALPPDADWGSVLLEVNVLDYEEVDGPLQIAPVAPPVTWVDGEEIIGWGENAEHIVDGKNTLVYGSDSFFPDQNAIVIALSQMRKWNFVQLAFNPVQYNPVTGKVRVAQQVEISLSVKAGDLSGEPSLSDTIMDYVAADLFYNYDTAVQWYGGEPDQPSLPTTYVIITTNAIESGSTNLASFISHKQSQGYTVLTITQDEYGSLTGQSPNGTAEKIRKWLIDNYTSQSIEYVLLIGNPDPDDPSSSTDPVGDVPMKMLWPRRGATTDPEYDESPSDYFYADLTGNWDLDGDVFFGEYNGDRGTGGIDFANEVYVGRIPVYSTSYTALDSILQKIIDYETASSASISWREFALLPMSFSDSSTDGASLAESMKSNYLNSAGYTSWTMYQQGSLCTAANSSYTSNQELHGDTVVRDRWSANDYGIVNWWGHGSSTSASYGYGACGWGNLFSSSQAIDLDDDHPSFVYQCSCTNGYPEVSNNLGYSILANGGIGTVSASRVSWYAPGTWSPSTLKADNASIGYYWHREIVVNDRSAGEALFLAKSSQGNFWGDQSYMNKYDFNLYGDPSTKITSSSSANNPPYTPSNPNPADGATGVSATTDLGWTGGDPDTGDTVTYDVYFEANDTTPNPLLCNDVSSPSCDPGTLAYNTHYYWKVVATDNHAASTTGPTWDFTTGSEPDVGPLVYDSHDVDDDTSGNSNGNNNGIVDCGESIELYVWLNNQGSDTATGVNTTISTSDSYVTWLYNTSSAYPDIPGSGTEENLDDFDFSVDPSTPNGHNIQFNLNITASNGGPWTDSFTVPVTCATVKPYHVYLPLIIRSVSGSPNPILNGDFEAGQDGSWTEYSSNGFDLIFSEPSLAHGGDWLVWLGGYYEETSQLSQVVSINPGSPYLHFWYYAASEDVCGWDFFWVKINSSVIDDMDLCTTTNTGGWVEWVIDLSAYAGSSVTIMFDVYADVINNSNLFLDDVSLSSSSSAMLGMFPSIEPLSDLTKTKE